MNALSIHPNTSRKRHAAYLIYALLAYAAISTRGALPFQVGGMEWPGGSGTNCSGTNFAGNQFYVIQENENLTNFLLGGGSGPVTFNVTSGPAHGSVTMLDPTTGSNYYAPALNYLGNDLFEYNVALSGCLNPSASNGFEAITTALTNVQCYTWHPFAGIPTICFLGSIVFQIDTNFINTNFNWTVTLSDASGLMAATWQYFAGGDICNSWTATAGASAACTAGLSPRVTFIRSLAGLGSVCDSPGDSITWTLCTNCPTCGLSVTPLTTGSCQEPSNLVFSIISATANQVVWNVTNTAVIVDGGESISVVTTVTGGGAAMINYNGPFNYNLNGLSANIFVNDDGIVNCTHLNAWLHLNAGAGTGTLNKTTTDVFSNIVNISASATGAVTNWGLTITNTFQ